MFTGHLARQLQDVCYIVLCSRSSFEGDLSPNVYNREYRLRDILSIAHSLLAEHVSCTYGLGRTGHKQQPTLAGEGSSWVWPLWQMLPLSSLCLSDPPLRAAGKSGR